MTDHRGALPPENPPRPRADAPDNPPRRPHLPSATIWPVVLASGVTFAVAGLITSPLLVVFGAVVTAVSLGGWVSELTRGRR